MGKIYGEFREDVHVQKVEYDPALPNYIAFDWGWSNPLAAIEFQVTPMDEIRVWREHYLARTTIPEHVRMMKKREQPPGYKITMCFGDAADPEAAAQISQLLAPCAAMPEAKENWREGIELVKQFLAVEEEIDLDEEWRIHVTPKTRFLVDHSCVNTRKEFNNYKTKEPIKGQNVPEMGQKIQDHAMDAIRYGLMHLFKVGATYHLDDVYEAEEFMRTQAGLYVPQGAYAASDTLDSRPGDTSGLGDAAGFFTFSNTSMGRF